MGINNSFLPDNGFVWNEFVVFGINHASNFGKQCFVAKMAYEHSDTLKVFRPAQSMNSAWPSWPKEATLIFYGPVSDMWMSLEKVIYGYAGRKKSTGEHNRHRLCPMVLVKRLSQRGCASSTTLRINTAVVSGVLMRTSLIPCFWPRAKESGFSGDTVKYKDSTRPSDLSKPFST